MAKISTTAAYGMDDVIPCGVYKGKTVKEMVGKHKIIKLLSDGFNFTDDVIDAAHIKKTVREEKAWLQVREVAESNSRIYAKDTASLKQVLNDINTIEKEAYNGYNSEDASIQDDE